MRAISDELFLVSSQRRHPVRIAAVDLPGQLEELFPLGARLDRFSDKRRRHQSCGIILSSGVIVLRLIRLCGMVDDSRNHLAADSGVGRVMKYLVTGATGLVGITSCASFWMPAKTCGCWCGPPATLAAWTGCRSRKRWAMCATRLRSRLPARALSASFMRPASYTWAGRSSICIGKST